MNEPIDFQMDERGIAVLTVNRPEARNALNWAAQEAFAAGVARVAASDGVRILIVTGAGEQAFVSGGDLKELCGETDTAVGERLNRIMSGALAQLTELPLPVIAAVNGDTFGGGCEILTACDLRLAATHARFSFAQVRNALTTGWGGTGRLVQLIGQSQASELLLTARLFDAAEAHRLGLVHRLTPPETSVLDAALVWANELADLPRGALAATKALAHAAVHLSLPQTYQAETRLFTHLWSQPDHIEALNAFVEKRPPIFNRD